MKNKHVILVLTIGLILMATTSLMTTNAIRNINQQQTAGTSYEIQTSKAFTHANIKTDGTNLNLGSIEIGSWQHQENGMILINDLNGKHYLVHATNVIFFNQ